MNIKKVAFWTTTGLFAAAMTAGGIMDIVQPDDMVATMTHLGFPMYVATMLGVWKLLGVGALLAPRLPLLKEWAYAGFVFDLIGAAVAHAAVGDAVGQVAPPVMMLGLAVASWTLRPASRRLAPATEHRSSSVGQLVKAG